MTQRLFVSQKGERNENPGTDGHGGSLRSTARITGIHRDTLCKLVVRFGDGCKRFLDQRMHGLKLDHLEFDEQWTFVLKKQSRLTMEERARRGGLERGLNMVDVNRGEHQSKMLASGLEVNLVRHPGSSAWRLSSFDASWGSLERGSLISKRWFAERMGLGKREFETPEAAYDFAERHVKLTPPISATQS